MDSFKPEAKNIVALFTNADSKFSIPDYQRPYKWKDDEVNQLLIDILENYENKESSYFLGSIITTKSKGCYSIIDGQQRTITLQLILKAFSALLEYNKCNDDILEDIKNSILQKGKDARVKIEVDQSDRLKFENILKENYEILLNKTKPSNKELNTEKPEAKFNNTLCLCKEKFKDYKSKEIIKIVKYILNKIYVVHINCDNIQMAMTLFETLNTRGLDLTTADLFKNHLIKAALKKDIDMIKTEWAKIIQIANDVGTDVNEIIFLYADYLLGKHPDKKVYNSLTEYIKKNKKTSTQIINELSTLSQNYKDKLKQEDKYLNSLWYLPWRYWKSILLTAHQKELSTKEITNLKKCLFKALYILWIEENDSSKIREYASKIIRGIKGEKENDKDKDAIDYTKILKEIISLKNKESFKEKILTTSAYYKSWCGALLATIEYHISDNDSPQLIEFGKDLHLEHILPKSNNPQKPHKGWEHITQDVMDKYTNSIANLMILKSTKNYKVGIKCFDEKCDLYKKDGRLSYKTSELVCNKRYGKKWNKAALQKRFLFLIEEINKIFGTNIDKIKSEPIE